MMHAGALEANPVRPLDEQVTPNERLTLLVRAEYAFVWRTLRRFGVPSSDADDAAQRVFLVAAEKLARIREGRERAFLFGTAVRIANKERRRLSLRASIQDDGLDERLCAEPGTDELLEQRRARELLDAFIDTLPNDLKAVFVLYEVEEFTMAEIAELLEVPAGTVASRLRRARARFFQYVEEVKQQHRGGDE